MLESMTCYFTETLDKFAHCVLRGVLPGCEALPVACRELWEAGLDGGCEDSAGRVSPTSPADEWPHSGRCSF